ncbi:LytR C-terminal domain-containing protein [Melioribacter sp. OK-6-Me]|uniref:LytR C-terminal domain-containing protein n=1 Tax=unclassified Melioribacter TaxID=2627329 RepID=UPI003ED87B36
METNKKLPDKNENKVSTVKNLFLNIANFLLIAVIVLMVYSIYVKIQNSDNEYNSNILSGEPSEIIQVEVLNGCGISGVGERFTDYLRNNGFDVVNVENYIRFDIDETIVIDRIGNKANALKVANALGVKRGNIIQQLNEDYFLDVSIIIGRDYYLLKPTETKR